MLCQLELLTRFFSIAAWPNHARLQHTIVIGARYRRRSLNLHLFMLGMAAAAGAEFLDRKLLGLALLISAAGIVAPLTSIALKSNKVSHRCNPVWLGLKPIARSKLSKPTMGIGPMTSSLPRKCSTD